MKDLKDMKRVLLKLSGEALAGDKKTGFDEATCADAARQVKTLVDEGLQVAIVIGGGNFWRGRTSESMERTKADQIGMLATVMNCIYVSDAFRTAGMETEVYTPFVCGAFTELFSKDKAVKALDEGKVVFFAGGTGQRMNSKTRPKQFLELHEKPILVYTLEAFQKHEEIDGIILVTLKDWINYCLELKEKYHLTKLKSIIPGGKTATESAFNGLARANELFPSDSIVLIHDGVRPLVDEETITKNIECVKEHGTAITVSPAIETITVSDSNENSGVIKEVIERAKCQMARAPQGFYLNEILDVYKKAANDKETSFIDSATMMMHYGYKLYTVYGKAENIKITTPNDFFMFRAIVDARENSQIFGI